MPLNPLDPLSEQIASINLPQDLPTHVDHDVVIPKSVPTPGTGEYVIKLPKTSISLPGETIREVLNEGVPSFQVFDSSGKRVYYDQVVDKHGDYLYLTDTAGHGQAIHKESIGQTLYPDGHGGIAVDATSLHPGKFVMVNILDRIFRLLTKILESMQRVAINQAQRLSFLTAWQRAYTDQMNQIHAFTSNNGDASGISGGSGTEFREALNQANSQFIEIMRSNRSLISDDAKALQSLVNQTNDAVSQQANMATSILQQFSTILGSIYR